MGGRIVVIWPQHDILTLTLKLNIFLSYSHTNKQNNFIMPISFIYLNFSFQKPNTHLSLFNYTNNSSARETTLGHNKIFMFIEKVSKSFDSSVALMWFIYTYFYSFRISHVYE